jgi:hypothetical protein
MEPEYHLLEYPANLVSGVLVANLIVTLRRRRATRSNTSFVAILRH